MPDVTTVRVVHRAWLRVANEMPQQLWDDRGMGGRAKSLWTVNNLRLVWATNGWNQPPGPFHEMRDWPFLLEDIQQRLAIPRKLSTIEAGGVEDEGGTLVSHIMGRGNPLPASSELESGPTAAEVDEADEADDDDCRCESPVAE